MWNGLVTFCKWALRMVWNAFWLCASGVSGIFALVALFGFGSMMVLQLQGYPLTGIVILCLGVILMFGAVSGGCFSLLIRKKAAVAGAEGLELNLTQTTETEQETEEVSYE